MPKLKKEKVEGEVEAQDSDNLDSANQYFEPTND
jgi:hypothetical protein